MRRIIKGKEPRAWTRHRHHPNAVFSHAPAHAKHALVRALYREQGYICAYCQRRIPTEKRKKHAGNCDHKVEHVLPQSLHRAQQCDYHNLVICCPGAIGSEVQWGNPELRRVHCDTAKGNRELSFSLLDPEFFEALHFRNDGRIYSTNPQWDNEINTVLNLNHPLLCQNRRKVWQGVRRIIAKRGGDKVSPLVLERMIRKWDEKYPDESEGKPRYVYHEYCSIVVYMLRKKLRKLEKHRT